MTENRKVLVVEDEEALGRLIGMYLEGEDFDALYASNGKEGLDEMRQHDPYAIITDFQMPVMNGYEFARQARAEGYRKPIFLISADFEHLKNKSPEKYPDADVVFNGYLTKPMNRDEFLQFVRSRLVTEA